MASVPVTADSLPQDPPLTPELETWLAATMDAMAAVAFRRGWEACLAAQTSSPPSPATPVTSRPRLTLVPNLGGT